MSTPKAKKIEHMYMHRMKNLIIKRSNEEEEGMSMISFFEKWRKQEDFSNRNKIFKSLCVPRKFNKQEWSKQTEINIWDATKK